MTNKPNRLMPKRHNYALLSFGLAIIAAAVLFVPFMVYNGGVFYYYGDFNVQEIPFYQLAHQTVKSGQLGWSHITDLGSDFLSSYSFYLLGSPFFWLAIPFPNEFVPYLIGPLLILKFGCCSLAGYIYLKRYVRCKGYAVLGGLLYAFSGFSIYNVFFFHFHEPMIVFPLLLAALDSFLYDKRRGVFAAAVFAACVVNYYFFVGQVLFVVMYYLMLMLTKTCRFRLREFLILAVEVIIGFSASAFVLLPSVLGVMGNPRLESLPNGWDSLVHDLPQRYWLIITAFFFPADMPAFPVFTPDSNCKWASVAGWLPLFSMTGVIAFMQLAKRDWLKKLITLLVLFAFVPVLNSMFQLMNSSIYYARWFYMLVLMFALATVRAVEDRQSDWKRAVAWSASITAGVILFIGLMPKITENNNGSEDFSLGVQATFERFWIYALLALMSMLAFVLILKKYKGDNAKFAVVSVSGVLAVSLVSSGFIIATGAISSSTTEPIKNDILNAGDRIDIDDLAYVRSDFYECVDNTAMFWQIPSINCFQSSVSSSIMEFYDAMGITRDVASRPDVSGYGLRALLSCKYLFDYQADGEAGSDNSFLDEDGNEKMPYWSYLKTSNGFDIYQNDCYIPMGFAYGDYVTQEEFDRISSVHKTEAILYSMVLTKEQMKKYSDITGYSEQEYEKLYGNDPQSFESVVDGYRYGSDEYREQCERLKASSCKSFEYTESGFKAEYSNNSDDTLLFFSVPYSEGFSATVNGESVEIEKVNYGFMAVRVDGYSDSVIEFTYETPGFKAGSAISLAALAGFVIYISVVIIYRRKTKLSKADNSSP